jgi:hypothetical protein
VLLPLVMALPVTVLLELKLDVTEMLVLVHVAVVVDLVRVMLVALVEAKMAALLFRLSELSRQSKDRAAHDKKANARIPGG